MKTCPKCGAENQDYATFCQSCGSRLIEEKQGLNQENKGNLDNKTKKSKLLLITSRSFVGHYGLGLILLLVLLIWLIIPLIILIFLYISNKTYTYMIYTDKIVYEGGFVSRESKVQTLTKVLSASYDQSFFGRIFDYGSVYVNLVGRGGLYIEDCIDPSGTCSLFQKMIVSGDELQQIITE